MRNIKSFVVLVVVFVFFLGLSCEAQMLWENPAEKFPEKKCSAKKLKSDLILPSSLDYSSEMPPVMNQGSQGSCVAFALSYLKSWEERKELGWEYSDSTIFSPAYVYNMNNYGTDDGLSFSKAIEFLADYGCLTLAEFPYDQSDYKTKPTLRGQVSGLPFYIASWSYISRYDNWGDMKTTVVKEHLQDEPVIIALPIFEGYASLSRIYCLSAIRGLSESYIGHGVCVVGYDDDMKTSDGQGAFKAINSWGEKWGDKGYFYLSYQMVDSLCSAYFLTDGQNADPDFTAIGYTAWNSGSSSIKVNAAVNNLIVDSRLIGSADSLLVVYRELPRGVNRLEMESAMLGGKNPTIYSLDIIKLKGYSHPAYDYSASIFDTVLLTSYGEYSEYHYSKVNFVFRDQKDITGVSGLKSAATDEGCFVNYPNPFGRYTTFSFTLAAKSQVSLDLYDIAGIKVANLANGQMSSGKCSIDFRSSLKPGAYLAVLLVGNEKKTIKIQKTE